MAAVARKSTSVSQDHASADSLAVTGKSASATQNFASVTQHRPPLYQKLDESEIDPVASDAASVPKCQQDFVKVNISETELSNKRILPE